MVVSLFISAADFLHYEYILGMVAQLKYDNLQLSAFKN